MSIAVRFDNVINIKTSNSLPLDAEAGDIVFHQNVHKAYDGSDWHSLY